MNIDQIFGADARLENDAIVIPLARLQELSIDTANLDGEKLLASLILLSYEVYFKNNNLDTQRVTLSKSINAPVVIDGDEFVEYGFNYKFVKPYTTPLFDPDDV
jgi:hypothetical protein